MSLFLRATRNLSFKFIGEVLTRLLSFFFYIYLARILGDELFGRYSFAFSYTAIFMILMDLGVNAITTREISSHRYDYHVYLFHSIILKIFLIVLGFLFIRFSIRLFNYPQEVVAVVDGMAVFTISIAFNDYLAAVFSGFEKMEYEALLKAVNRIFVLGVVVWLGRRNRGLILLVRNIAIFSLISSFLGILLLIVKKYINFKVKIEKKIIFKILKYSLPVALAGGMIIIYTRIDVVMLSFFNRAEHEIGWYSSALKLVETLQSFPYLIVTAFYPILADFFINDLTRFKKTFEQMFRVLTVIIFPVVVGTFVLADRFIISIYGEQFLPAVRVLKISIWAAVFIFYNSGLVFSLIAGHKQNLNIFGSLGCVLVSILVNLILIPRFGYLGAAWGRLSGEFALFIISIYFVTKKLFKFSPFVWFKYPFLGTLIMAVFIIKFKTLPLLMLVIIGAIIYFLILYFIGGLQEFKRLIFEAKRIWRKE